MENTITMFLALLILVCGLLYATRIKGPLGRSVNYVLRGIKNIIKKSFKALWKSIFKNKKGGGHAQKI